MMELTKKQAQVLAFIQARMPRVWRAPSYREIAACRGVAVQSNYQHARRLERKGALTTVQLHRNSRLSPQYGPPTCLPMTGRVAASTSIRAVKNLEGSLEIDCLLGNQSNPSSSVSRKTTWWTDRAAMATTRSSPVMG
jgi:SOS-response transcriptional repressor LexA